MQVIEHSKTIQIHGGHGSHAGRVGTVATLMFIWEFPHVFMHWVEMINYFSDLQEKGYENVDPGDKVGRFISYYLFT